MSRAGEILALHATGLHSAEIARRAACSTSRVSAVLKTAGVAANPRAREWRCEACGDSVAKGSTRCASCAHSGHRRGLLDFDAYDVEDRGFATACWIYRKQPHDGGYAQMKMPDGSQPGAHRAFYEHHVGPIPPGLTIDHLCCVRRCVNPAHLEPVTRGENARRGVERRRLARAL